MKINQGGGQKRSSQDVAYHRGYHAGREGQPFESCPYRDKRQVEGPGRGKPTWALGFRRQWQSGWLAATQTSFFDLIEKAG